MTKERIGLKIICLLRDLANNGAKVTFSEDWGGNSLTLDIEHVKLNTHSHCALHDSSEKQLEKHVIETLAKWLQFIEDGEKRVQL